MKFGDVLKMEPILGMRTTPIRVMFICPDNFDGKVDTYFKAFGLGEDTDWDGRVLKLTLKNWALDES